MDPSSLDSSRVRVKGLKETEEEFNNFMHKVTEVNGIVKKLTSRDEFLNEMGIAEADRFLGTPVVEEPSELTVKDDKTVINKIKDEEPLGENEMSKGTVNLDFSQLLSPDYFRPCSWLRLLF